jgi:hypothetical protein
VTAKSNFTDDEWARLRRAPFVAGMAITIADPGGPIEVSKETVASLKSASVPPSEEELLLSVSHDIQAQVQSKQSPMGDFKFNKNEDAGGQVLNELSEANRIVTAKATPEEAAAYRRWILATAQAAADAAKEGGFLGFGAEQVSKGEQGMLDRLRSTLGTT